MLPSALRMLVVAGIIATALPPEVAAQSASSLPEFNKEYRLGFHGSAGISLGWFRHRPGSTRGFGLTVAVDWEMLNFEFLDGTCTVTIPGYGTSSHPCSRNVWNALHVGATMVAKSSRWYGLEAGPSLTFYRNGDEAGKPGFMGGAHGVAEIGWRPFFAGVGLRAGVATDPYFGTGFEMVWAPHLRLVFHRLN